MVLYRDQTQSRLQLQAWQERRVGKPAKGGRAIGREEPRHRDQPTEEVQPIREHVQAGEGHIRCANLQGHQRIREPRKQGSGEEQQHDGAVHREHLVELGRVVDDLQPGRGQFRTDDEGHQPAHHEEEEGRGEVEVPDDLVVGRRERPDKGGMPYLAHREPHILSRP